MRHLQRRVRHLERRELQPVLGPRQPPFLRQPVVERRRGERRDLPEDRQHRRPFAHLLQRALADARRVVVQAEDERRDARRRCAAPARCSTAAYSPGLLKLLLTLARFAGSSDSMPMKIHLPPDAAIRSSSSSSRSRLALICPTQESLRARRDDVAQQRFGALHVDGEIVVHEEDRDLALRVLRARCLEPQHLVHDALVGAEADGIAEESRHRAEFAAVGTAAAGSRSG